MFFMVERYSCEMLCIYKIHIICILNTKKIYIINVRIIKLPFYDTYVMLLFVHNIYLSILYAHEHTTHHMFIFLLPLIACCCSSCDNKDELMLMLLLLTLPMVLMAFSSEREKNELKKFAIGFWTVAQNPIFIIFQNF